MALLNANMFSDRMEEITTTITVPAYNTQVVPVYSDYIELPKGANIAVGTMFSATSAGTIAIKLELEQGNDGTNFAVPTDVSAISASWNGSGLLISNVTPDVTRYARIKLSGLATHSADSTVSITINIVAD